MKERKSVRKIKKANISLERIRNWDRKQKLPLWKEKNRKADKRREKKINVSLVEENKKLDMRKWTDKKIYVCNISHPWYRWSRAWGYPWGAAWWGWSPCRSPRSGCPALLWHRQMPKRSTWVIQSKWKSFVKYTNHELSCRLTLSYPGQCYGSGWIRFFRRIGSVVKKPGSVVFCY